MHDTKPWYASLTLWGAIVTLLASALALFHVNPDERLRHDLRDGLLAASTLAGGAASLWGRLRASRRILTPGTVQTTARPRPQNWRMNAALPFAPILLLFPLTQCTGCSALTRPPPDYAAADRATYEAGGAGVRAVRPGRRVARRRAEEPPWPHARGLGGADPSCCAQIRSTKSETRNKSKGPKSE